MTIKKYIVSFVAVGAIAFFALLSSAIHWIIEESFASLELDHSRTDLERGREAVAYECKKLDELLVDWAVWDDAKAFVLGGEPEFVESNLNDRTLAALRLSAILFFDAQGRLVWGKGFDPVQGAEAPTPAGLLERLRRDPSFLAVSRFEDRVSGLALLPDGAFFLAVCPILSSAGAGPAAGVLVMARAIGEEGVAAIAERVRLPLALQRADSPLPEDLASLRADRAGPGEAALGPLSETSLGGVAVLTDLWGQPALRMEVRLPREFSLHGKQAARRSMAWVGAGGAAFMALLLLALERRVVGRVVGLTRQVEALDGKAESIGRITLAGADELATLARLINSFLFEIERSRQLYVRQFQETRSQEEYLQKILDSIQAGVMLIDPVTRRVVEINDFAASCVGLPRGDLIGQSCHGFVCPSLEGHCPITDQGHSGEQTIRRLLRRDGSCMAILKTVSRIERSGQQLLLETFINVDELYKTQEALRKAEETYRTVFMNTGTATFRVESDGVVSLVNQEFEKLSGHGREEVEGKRHFKDFFDPQDAAILQQHHVNRRQDPKLAPRNYEARFITRRGDFRVVRLTVALIPDTQATIVSLEDVTAFKDSERQLRHQALHDSLTGLPNRLLLHDRLEQALEVSRRERCAVAVLLLDLDRFKDINDSLGHQAGDRLLLQAAERFKGALPRADTIARLGGDEFVVILGGPADAGRAGATAARLLDCLAGPFQVDGHVLHVGSSIGIALSSGPEDSPDALLRNADMAMYRAKAEGRNTYSFYSRDLMDQTVRRLTMENGLRRALKGESGSIEVHYQPKVSLPDARVRGFEALARWRKEDGSLVPPDQFIPVAESTGLVASLCESVLDCACRQTAMWSQAASLDLTIAVNVAPSQFLQPDLAERILAVTARAGLPPTALELEITEDTLLTGQAEVIQTMRRLSDAGIRIILDDFGKGYSSLVYIKRLPISGIKIDRAFIGGLPGDADDAAIVRAITSMAGNLSMSVVAEGVETQEQLRFLADLGCREFQGFLFSRPLPVAEATAFLAARGLLPAVA